MRNFLLSGMTKDFSTTLTPRVEPVTYRNFDPGVAPLVTGTRHAIYGNSDFPMRTVDGHVLLREVVAEVNANYEHGAHAPVMRVCMLDGIATSLNEIRDEDLERWWWLPKEWLP